MIRYMLFETAWGPFATVLREARLVATGLPQLKKNLRRTIERRWPDAEERTDLLPRFRQQVVDYFDGEPVRFDVDIDLRDMPDFRTRVLEACRRIPYGETATYADLARAAGNPRAARAVGSAMAGNPLPLVIPCHRVIRSDGSFGGFSSPRGIKEKVRLLKLEQALPPNSVEWQGSASQPALRRWSAGGYNPSSKTAAECVA